MKIKSENYSKNINFYSRNKNVRKADDIQRRARNVFPVLSPSYIDEFYSSTRLINNLPINLQARMIFKKIDRKLTALRKVTKEPGKYGIEEPSFLRETPNATLLNNIQLLRVGNCEECAATVLAALAANGYYNSQKVYLGLEVQYIDKKTGEISYNEVEPLDHSFVITTLDKENPKEKDKIVIDSWLGFADSISGANARYKKMYKQEDLDNILSYHRSIFRLNMAIKTGKTIDFNDYELHSNIVFYPASSLTENELKQLGTYSRIMYNDLVLPSLTN